MLTFIFRQFGLKFLKLECTIGTGISSQAQGKLIYSFCCVSLDPHQLTTIKLMEPREKVYQHEGNNPTPNREPKMPSVDPHQPEQGANSVKRLTQENIGCFRARDPQTTCGDSPDRPGQTWQNPKWLYGLFQSAVERRRTCIASLVVGMQAPLATCTAADPNWDFSRESPRLRH